MFTVVVAAAVAPTPTSVATSLSSWQVALVVAYMPGMAFLGGGAVAVVAWLLVADVVNSWGRRQEEPGGVSIVGSLAEHRLVF